MIQVIYPDLWCRRREAACFLSTDEKILAKGCTYGDCRYRLEKKTLEEFFKREEK